MHKYAQSGKDLGVLLTGKVTMSHIPTIKKMQAMGLAKQPKFITDAYSTNINENSTLYFILNGLK